MRITPSPKKSRSSIFVPAERIRHIEELLGKMREFLKQKEDPYESEDFCLTCGEKATDNCFKKDHLILLEDSETSEVSIWADAIEWVLKQIKGEEK